MQLPQNIFIIRVRIFNCWNSSWHTMSTQKTISKELQARLRISLHPSILRKMILYRCFPQLNFLPEEIYISEQEYYLCVDEMS